MPFFSIVIPTYNRADYLMIAVDSILKQTYADWELLVIDDGSTDDTKERLAAFTSDQRVKYVYQDNAKESAARNRGMAMSEGQYVCLLDSDDSFLENHLSVLFERIQKENYPVAVLHTLITRKHTNGKLADRQQTIEKLEGHHPIYKIWKNELLPSSSCIHKQITNEFQFRLDIFAGEDSEFFYRIALKYPIISIEQYTVIYLIHDTNADRFYDSKPMYFENRLHYLQVLNDRPEIKSVFPAGHFEKRMAQMNRWKAHAHYKYHERGAAIKCVLKSLTQDPSTIFKLDTYRDLARFLLK
jgi:glycosyltransferase involved in cell wall biosynthesis